MLIFHIAALLTKIRQKLYTDLFNQMNRVWSKRGLSAYPMGLVYLPSGNLKPALGLAIDQGGVWKLLNSALLW